MAEKTRMAETMAETRMAEKMEILPLPLAETMAEKLLPQTLPSWWNLLLSDVSSSS